MAQGINTNACTLSRVDTARRPRQKLELMACCYYYYYYYYYYSTTLQFATHNHVNATISKTDVTPNMGGRYRGS